ncbi:MAG: hypothetical protein ACKVS6_02350 [Planctomycetota bacterium]
MMLSFATDSAPPMSWIQLGGFFCIEFGTGTLGALAFVPPAPVGAPFYRIVASLAAIPLALGLWLLSLVGGATTVITILVLGALVALPFFCMPTKGRMRWAALATAIGATGAAVIVNLLSSLEAGLGLRGIAVLSALGSGLLVGVIGVAMTLGHAYLTYPNLKLSHLERLNRVSAAVLLLKTLFVIITVYVFAKDFEPLRAAIGTSMGQFWLLTRFAAGLAIPFVFYWMVKSSLLYKNTRSATGILYASTALVLIGEALAMSLRGQAGGVPL